MTPMRTVGNTLMFIEPGSDGRWFTDDDVQSIYDANEIIYCGYRYAAETQNYYARNRRYSPALLQLGAPSAPWRKIHRRGRGGTQRNRWRHGSLNVGLKLV